MALAAKNAKIAKRRERSRLSRPKREGRAPSRPFGEAALSPLHPVGRAHRARREGGENVRVEHVERVEGKARDDGNSKVSRKKVVIGLVALLGLAVIGGLWWEASKLFWEKEVTDKDKEIVTPTRSERGVRRKVQLWEGGPYWACKNIGAEESWESGYYFWWGDTVGYKRQGNVWVASDGSKSNFSFEDKDTPTYQKSITDLQREGWITSDNILAPEHDAAHAHWGGDWRMPTKQELDDLNEKCDWTRKEMNGVRGYVVRGRGSYSSAWIFLPCAGYGLGTSLYNAGSGGMASTGRPFRTRTTATTRGTSTSIRATTARPTSTAATGSLFVLSKGSPNSERSERIQFFNSLILPFRTVVSPASPTGGSRLSRPKRVSLSAAAPKSLAMSAAALYYILSERSTLTSCSDLLVGRSFLRNASMPRPASEIPRPSKLDRSWMPSRMTLAYENRL